MAMVYSEQRELTWRTRISYGVGHILNDLCGGMWFTYLLVYFHKVAKFSVVNAGTFLLFGQLVDACCTPIVALEMDKTGECKYGRRKLWHLIGSLMVAFSFPFVFILCIGCAGAHQWAMFFYYVPFIFIFQSGWGMTQIAHLSLIPELADSVHDKVELNAGRYAATVSSNIFVFIITWIMLDSGKEELDPNKLSASDAKAFMYIVFIVVGVGLFFVVIFHVGVQERPRDCSHEFASKSSKRSASNWVMWFKVPQFYQTAILYMCVRLIVNITQVYIPMFTLETLHLTKDKIAIMPLVMYCSGFISTFMSKPLNKLIGRKGVFFFGLVVIFAACFWMWFVPARNSQIYGVSVLLGVGGSTLLVTALTMLADLIGDNVETSAFVYGAMSFMDKMSNGVVVQIVQVFYPKGNKSTPNAGGEYYRRVMVFVTGCAALLALITLITTLKKTKTGEKQKDGEKDGEDNEDDERRHLLSSHSINKSKDFSWSLVYIKGPLTPYEPAIRSHLLSQDEPSQAIQLTESGRHKARGKSLSDSIPPIYESVM